jgi:hypothetical protein
MKRIYSIVLFVLFASVANAQVTIWTEDFNYSDGTTTGQGSPAISTWTADGAATGFFGNVLGYTLVQSNYLEGSRTTGSNFFNTWAKEFMEINSGDPIEIAAYFDVSISIDLTSSGTQAGDYLQVQYSLDGNSNWVDFPGTPLTGDFGNTTASVTGLNGNLLYIKIRMHNDASGEIYTADHIVVSGFNSPPHTDFYALPLVTDINQTISFFDVSTNSPTSWTWSFSGPGTATFVNSTNANSQNPQVQFNAYGLYTASLVTNTGSEAKSDYIAVVMTYNMGNGTQTTCSGLFYDSGGPANDYSNSEDYTMTFYPSTSGAMVEVAFTMFNVQPKFIFLDTDYLEIFDGVNTSATQIGGRYSGTISPETVTASNPAGALTFHFVSNGGTTRPGWQATISCVMPPVNNDCSNAIAIGEVTDMPYSTAGATASGQHPGCGGGNPIDIWYAYTPSSSGLASFDLCGSIYDTRLAVWDACGGTALACNDDDDGCGTGSTSSYLELDVIGGSTYFVQVSGFESATGTGTLTISLLSYPENDDCTTATPINEVTDLPFSTSLATASGVNPSCGGSTPIDIWYAYTATISGDATFDLCGSAYDTRIAIWDACGGNELDCNDDDCGFQSSVTMPVILGTTYYVQVSGYNSDIGDGDLSIFVTGEDQNTLDFDGINDYVSVGNSNDINTGGPFPNRTIETWFYAENINTSSKQVIWEEGGGSRGFNIYIYNGALYVGGWNINETSWNGTWLSTTTISSQRWHHVTLRLQNGNDNVEADKFKGFLDGTEFGSGPASQVYAHGGNNSLGRSGGTRFHDGNGSTGSYFQGKIDELRIWNEARTLFDIRNDMHRELPFPIAETNLGAYFRFNQSSGTALPDNSGNGNNGTTNNMNNADWVASTAPIPYNSVLAGNWDTDATWDIGQMTPVNDWARVLVSNSVHLNQDQTLKSLIVYNTGALIVDAGNSLTMDGTIVNMAGTSGLVLKADVLGIASLVHNTAGIDGTVEEYLSSQQWHYVSSPIGGATIATYFDIYLMTFDEPTGTWNYLVNPITTPMNVGQGYAAWASDAITGNTIVSYEGLLNTGDIGYTSLTYTPASANTGNNLVGNPYPSSIEWNTNWTLTNIDATVHFYTGSGYVTWNNSGFGTATSGVIPPTQGFIAQVSSSGPASITFPQSERLNGSQAFYKVSPIKSSVTLEVEGNDYSDKIIVGFDNEATNSFDSKFDAYDLKGIDAAPQFYTIGDVEYTVNILNSESKEMVIPVGLDAGTPGIYSINVNNLEGFNGNSVILEDLKENTLIEMGQNDTYGFNIDMNDNSHRFNIHFKSGALGLGETNDSQISVYSVDNTVYIQKPAELEGNVFIYNMMGQEVYSQKAGNEELISIPVNNGTGYYVVKVQSSNTFETQKVFIK